MNINPKSPVSIAKGVGMFTALLVVSVAALKGIAFVVNMVMPGKGETVKGLARI